MILFSPKQAVAELKKSGIDMNFSFLNYAQSSQCRNWSDSSVSYAAGALVVHWGEFSQERRSLPEDPRIPAHFSILTYMPLPSHLSSYQSDPFPSSVIPYISSIEGHKKLTTAGILIRIVGPVIRFEPPLSYQPLLSTWGILDEAIEVCSRSFGCCKVRFVVVYVMLGGLEEVLVCPWCKSKTLLLTLNK